MAQPEAQPPPPDPYGPPVPPMGNASRAVLSGAAGTHAVAAGNDVSVGRDGARCQIMLNEPRVSGVHATLRLDAGQLYVRDEQSNNGTFLDGHRLAPNVWTMAPAGSTLRFGPAEFGVRLE
jgi:pSer/pThr/pTyr-binding forkhead associated (FHA) protein